MKRNFYTIFTISLLLCTTACGTKNKQDNLNVTTTEYMSTVCTKDSVDEFISVFGEGSGASLLEGIVFDKDHCYNVTPTAVSAETDIKIFKYSNSGATFALIDGEVFQICTYFGGYGFVNAVPWDYDEDGNLDLLIASSWGSGLHRSEISIFNTKTKQSIFLHDLPNTDLFVLATSPSFSSKELNDLPIYYEVYSVKIMMNDNNMADLACVATDVVGSVVLENGVPIFKPLGN